MKSNDSPVDPQESRFKRIRLVKKLLKYVPRRGNVHKYPFLKLFAEQARQRAYLWSFRVEEAVPALYAGWILTLIPVMSVQILLACLLAFIFRANVMILVLLQFVSTPFTVPFLWWLDYIVGNFVVKAFGSDEVQLIRQTYEQAGFKNMSDLWIHGEQCLRWFLTTSFGGIILGVIIGHISAWIYKAVAQRYRTQSQNNK